MHLEPTMKQVVIRRSVRKFAEKRLAPAAVEMDRTGERFASDKSGAQQTTACPYEYLPQNVESRQGFLFGGRE